MFSLIVTRLEVQNQGVVGAMTSLKPPGSDLSFPVPPQVSRDPRQHHSSPFLFFSYMDTRHIGLRVRSTLYGLILANCFFNDLIFKRSWGLELQPILSEERIQPENRKNKKKRANNERIAGKTKQAR